MYCKTCRSCPTQARGNRLFNGVTGEKVRVKTIKEHVATALHKSAAEALQAREYPVGGGIVSVFDRMDAAEQDKIVKLFNIAYFIVELFRFRYQYRKCLRYCRKCWYRYRRVLESRHLRYHVIY
ncbi:unnamed protein product [Arctogadus glacialis]